MGQNSEAPKELSRYWQRFTRQIKERLRKAKAHGYVGTADFDDVIANLDKVGAVLSDIARRAAILRSESVVPAANDGTLTPELDGEWVSRTKSRVNRLSNPVFETAKELRDIYREMRVERIISDKEYHVAIAIIMAMGKLHSSAEGRLARIEDANT